MLSVEAMSTSSNTLSSSPSSGASSSAPQGDRNPSPQQEDKELKEEERVMEDVDIASTLHMPAKPIAEENPVLEQVPQPSEEAHSERDQTDPQNDVLEEEVVEHRETVETPLVQDSQEKPESVQVAIKFISNL